MTGFDKTLNFMTPILNIVAMRAAEASAMANGIPSLDLMERAGSAAASAILAYGVPGEITVLCGPGNNGGDGYVVARHLAEAGRQIRVVADQPAASRDAAVMAERWQGPRDTADTGAAAPVLVDALFGTGLNRALDGRSQALLDRLAAAARCRVAIDLPSGVSSDDGRLLGAPPHCDLTVTFGSLKPAHCLQPAAAYCGRVVVADIGLGMLNSNLHTNIAPNLAPLATSTHKYARGAVLVLGGPVGAGGAARLAARAALRGGAGVVTLGVAADALAENAARLDAVMLARIDDAAALVARLLDLRIRAVVAGPGLGHDSRARDLVAALLSSSCPAIIDGDALTMFGGTPLGLRGAAVLTPHEGEFARLFGCLPGSKVDRARAAAALTGAIVVLKGPDTVIAAPDGTAVINTHASPHLATAGSGDVLAGAIAGLLAQGLTAFNAACAGVWLHGAAGQRGGAGLIADDLPELLAQALRVNA